MAPPKEKGGKRRNAATYSPLPRPQKSTRLCCTGMLGVMQRIETGQVFRLNCTLLNASQKEKNIPGRGRATLKLLERATLDRINAECHHPSNVIFKNRKKKRRLFVFYTFFHHDLAQEDFRREQNKLSHGLWIRHSNGLQYLRVEYCSSKCPCACP